MYWTTKKEIKENKRERSSQAGRGSLLVVRTREDIACHALPTEEKVKYDSPKTNAWADGEDEIHKKK